MNNHIELKHHKKKKKRIFPEESLRGEDEFELDEVKESNGEKKKNKKKNAFHEQLKTATGKVNALGVISKLKIGVGRWMKYVIKSKEERRGESLAREGPCDQGKGLGDFDETFEPSELMQSPSELKKALAASKKLHEYFKMLDKQSQGQTSSGKEKSVAVDFDRIEQYFQMGARLDWPDLHGQTVFHEAVRAWRVDVANYLFARAGDLDIININDNSGRTPLHVAAIVNNVQVAKMLLKNGANKDALTAFEYQSPVHYAAKYDSYDVMKALIKAKAEYKEIRDYKERTPLQLAAENGVSHMVSLLLELGAPVDVQDDQGELAIVLIMKNTRSLARDAMDHFIERDSIRRQQKIFVKNMVPKPKRDDDGTPPSCGPSLAKEAQFSDDSNRPKQKVTVPNIVSKLMKGYQSSCAQSPLEVITTNRLYDLVTHDVVKEVIKIKWKHFGKCGAVGNLILNLIFTLVWTVLGVYPNWMVQHKYIFPNDAWRVCLWCVAVGLTVYEIVNESIEYQKSRSKLKAWKKWKRDHIGQDLKYCHPQWPREKVFLEMRRKKIQNEEMEYVKDWWNIWDWICYFFLLICFVTHVTDVLLPVHSISLARGHIRFMAVTLILVWLRLMKSARAFSALGPFIVMLGQMMNDFVRFAFLYFEFYIPYLAAFWMLFGGVHVKNKYLENPPQGDTITTTIVPGYESVHKILFSVFRLTLVDDYPYDEMNEVDPVMADILLATWFALSTILCINLFIALLSDTFQRVYDNAQANALMLKAITIMDIEANLPKKTLEKHICLIHKGTVAEDYEDLPSKGESDLKKVAFQVKNELEEMREWFSDKFGPIQQAPDLTYQPERRLSLRPSTQIYEATHMWGHIQGIKEDMASMKTMLKEFIDSQNGNQRGRNVDERTPSPQDYYPVDEVVTSGGGLGLDEVDNLRPYKRSQSLIPLVDGDEYGVERRHSARRRKKKRKRRRLFEEEVDDPRGLVFRTSSPIVEVESFGFMEPPPQQVGLLGETPEPKV